MDPDFVDLSSKQNTGRLVNKILMIVFTIPFIYLVIYKFFNSKAISIGLLTLFLIQPVFIFMLNRFKKYSLSKIIGLLGYNSSIFLVSCSENSATGVHLHFISCCAVTIILFRYKERWKSVLFITLSIFLFLIVNLQAFDLLPYREYSPENVRLFFVIHTIGATIISCYCIFLILEVNYKTQKKINNKQEIIENQNRELRKTNKELDKFVYSASHDLKAPLSSILGLVNLLELDKQTPAEVYILKIKKQISKMETFMRDIVDYSRNERLEVTSDTIDLHNMVNEIWKSMAYFEKAQHITFENKIELHQHIDSDAYRLRVILNNLISNAIKYADHGKQNCYVRVSYGDENKHRHIRIEDNGIGITPGHLPQIFDMFYRASSASSGSGLGLYIAKESAEKMNYQIEARSELSKGTIFAIIIPM